ncbi:MAG: RidA family protein [Betaproteobacteria bacterium]
MRLMIVVLSTLAATAMALAQPSSRQIIRTGPDLGLPFSPGVKAGGLIYVSGTVATDAQGRLVAGDIAAQTRQALQNVDAVLKAAGSSLANAVSVMVYLTRADDFAAMNAEYRTHWPADPPTRTTIVTPLALAGARIEISAIAVPDGAERLAVRPAGWIPSPNPYSYAIRTGNTLFLSGLVSRNGRDNSHVAGDITKQTTTILDNAAEILKAGGMSFGDVVSGRVFLTDRASFRGMNEAYIARFPGAPPARATVRAGLSTPDYLVEVTLVAVKDASRTAVATPDEREASAARPASTARSPLSSAIRVGNRLYLSGMLGTNPTNKGDVKSQTAESLARIGRTLRAAGFDWSNVVEGIVYLPEMARFADMNAAYRDVFKSDFPTRTTAGAAPMNPDAQVEIMMTAVR